MNKDFFYAFISGWTILLIFWLVILIFIYLRKPIGSKLTAKLVIQSLLLFFLIFLVFVFLIIDSF